MSDVEVEPGAARDSVLVTSESFDNFDEQMSSSLEEIKNENAVGSLEDSNLEVLAGDAKEEESLKEENGVHVEDSSENSLEWTGKKKHIFVLSTAGKPIYSR